MLSIATTYYTNFFTSSSKYSAEITTKRHFTLTNPISEVQTTVSLLKLNKAVDPEGICAEMLKVCDDVVMSTLCDVINNMLDTAPGRHSLGTGILLPLNKQNKDHTIENTRPIILLAVIRKVLSLIVLQRIYPKADAFISQGQSGFRRGRSSADIIWVYRWVDAMAQRYQGFAMHVLGVDLTKAFDTVDRLLLLKVLRDEGIAGPDELHIISLLLKNIKLRVRINGYCGDSFSTTRGTPQGDGLSPILFAIYLEAALREFRQFLSDHQYRVGETLYADDVDFLSTNAATIDFVAVTSPALLAKWSLEVNSSKTERYSIQQGAEISVKKLGCMIDPAKEVQRRVALANAGFSSKWRLWFRNAIVSEKVRLRLYHALIMPILTYNIGTLGVSETLMKQLDTTHRRHLRCVLRIHYPNTISNKNLYERCNTTSISNLALLQRWRLFGHILRLSSKTPAREATAGYFHLLQSKKYKCHRGANKTTLPVLLQQDLRYIGCSLTTPQQLTHLSKIAKNRDQWASLVLQITTADRQLKQLQKKRKQQQYNTSDTTTPSAISEEDTTPPTSSKRSRLTDPLPRNNPRKRPAQHQDDNPEDASRKKTRRALGT